jgi:hypothetical protein
MIKQPTMKRTTTRKKITPRLGEIKELMAGDVDFLRPLVGLVVQALVLRTAQRRGSPP